MKFALTSPATSWSMEQVAAPEIVSMVERMRCKHRNALAYAVFDFSKLGVPQMRKRLIAGSPHIIAKLLRATAEQNRRCVKSVIAKCRGTHIRSSKKWLSRTPIANPKPGGSRFTYVKAGWNDFCHPVDGLSPTVVGRHALTWVTPTGKEGWHDVLYPSELAALQTFPPTYKWPTNKFQAYLQIGNAVPPRVAELLLRPETSVKHMDLAEGLRCNSPSLR